MHDSYDARPPFHDRKRHPSCDSGYVRLEGSMLQACTIPKAGIRNPTQAEMAWFGTWNEREYSVYLFNQRKYPVADEASIVVTPGSTAN